MGCQLWGAGRHLTMLHYCRHTVYHCRTAALPALTPSWHFPMPPMAVWPLVATMWRYRSPVRSGLWSLMAPACSILCKQTTGSRRHNGRWGLRDKWGLTPSGDVAVIYEVWFSSSIIKDNSSGTHCEIALNEKSTLVHVMGWCCQATNCYLSQIWPWSISRYGIASPQ